MNRLLAIFIVPLLAAGLVSGASSAPRAVNDLDARLAGYPQLTIRPGRYLWEIANSGAMLHEFAILPVPAGASQADVETAAMAMLEAEMTGDIGVARARLDDLGTAWAGWNGEAIAGVGVLSPGRTAYAQIALEEGTYGIVCYVPDPASGMPHLMLGMSDVFTVTS
jgi:hypothetical protein